MKILSLNAEHTVSEHVIALNVDEELTPEFMEKLNCGKLSTHSQGKILLLTKEKHIERFSKETLAWIQTCLDTAQEALEEIAKRRENMLSSLSEATGLPLA